jgi:hypothetical protein
LWASEAVGDTLGFEDLIGEFGAGLESERFGKDEGIITVEEDFFDLRVKGWLAMRPIGIVEMKMLLLLTLGILECYRQRRQERCQI